MLEAIQGKITSFGLVFELFYEKSFFTAYLKLPETKIRKNG